MNGHKRPESVLVVVYTRAGTVLLLKRADLPEFWQSVTGAMRWEEHDPRVSAVRELREETGLAISADSLRDLRLLQRFPIAAPLRHRYAAGVVENLEHAFALELDAEFAVSLAPSEHTEYSWFSVEQASSKMASWTNREALLAALGRS